MHEIEAAQRDLEEEAQGRDLRVHLRRPAALCELVHLEAAQIIPCCRIGRAAEKAGESLNVLEVIVLRLLAEPADGHVLKHAAAKIADRLVAHWGVLVLRLEVDEPLDPQDETLPITLPAALAGAHPRRLPTPQQAGARATLFIGPRRTSYGCLGYRGAALADRRDAVRRTLATRFGSDGRVIGKTSRMYSASAPRKLAA